MCVRVKYRWRRPVCVRVSEVQCNCRQSQPYLPVKNTIIPHSPSQAISPVSSSLLSLTPFLSLSASNYNLEGYFSPGQKKHTPHKPSLSGTIALSTPLPPTPLYLVSTLFSLPFFSSAESWESGNEQAVNTHHLSSQHLVFGVFVGERHGERFGGI